MARYAHSRRGDSERAWVLARHQAYRRWLRLGHDNRLPGLPRGLRPDASHVKHLTPPWPYRAELFDGDGPTDFCMRELERTIDELGAERIAAFIGEPVMGVAGMKSRPATTGPGCR